MYFKQILREDLGCAAYIVGSTDAHVAAVIDPRLDMVQEILDLAEQKELRITHIVETHNHADHVSGHGTLARLTGAKIHIHPGANAEYPHEPLEDGARIALGEVVLHAMHTPGHRPEHVAITVADTSRSEEPWLVLTGDSLLIGDVARPDLAVPGEEGGQRLHGSLFDRLLRLPDGVEVYPAHVAGSLCGRSMNLKPSSTIGYERRHSPALEPRSEAEFVAYMNEQLPERPANMEVIVETNRTVLEPALPNLRALAVEEFAGMLDSGHTVLDVRSPASFGAGHVPGSVNVYLDGGQFGTRVGFVIPAGADILLVLERDADADRVAGALAVVGYTRLSGYLAGGIPAWQAEGREVETTLQVSVQELGRQLEAVEDALTVLDVREPSEWEEGHIKGAVHIPFHRLQARLEDVPAGPLAVVCGSGVRSSLASSLLQRAGRRDLVNVTGGMDAWKSADLPTTDS